MLPVLVAPPNRLMAVVRSEDDRMLPAFSFNLSTNCAGVIDVGKAAVKRDRWTNWAMKLCLLFFQHSLPTGLTYNQPQANLLRIGQEFIETDHRYRELMRARER